MPQSNHRHLFRRDGLLGTVIEVSVAGVGPDSAAEAAAECFAEIERLQGVFNAFDEQSELSRWRRSETTPGPELTEVIAQAGGWRRKSRGAFEPAVGALMTLWDGAQASGRSPSDAEIARTIAEMDRNPSRQWSLNAIAKGWIVDRAAQHVLEVEEPVSAVVVNAGGDLLSLGGAPIVVGIEDPRRPFDNVPPLTTITVQHGAVATSGTARRGWRIGDRWYGHVIDPRTGHPVGHVESASVIAGNAATADVVATILTVLPVVDGLALADDLGVACLILDSGGRVHRNDRWRAAEVAPRVPRHPSARSQSDSVASPENEVMNPRNQE